MAQAPAEPDPTNDDLIGALDGALHSLPDKYRAPLILCYLEGKTNVEAARLLGIPTGSISSRLARGRELLRERLAHRWASADFSNRGSPMPHATPVPVPGPLAAATARAAVGLVGGQPVTDLDVSPDVKDLVRDALKGLEPPPSPRWVLAIWALLWVTATFVHWPFQHRPIDIDPGQSLSQAAPPVTNCHRPAPLPPH